MGYHSIMIRYISVSQLACPAFTWVLIGVALECTMHGTMKTNLQSSSLLTPYVVLYFLDFCKDRGKNYLEIEVDRV